MFLFCPLPVVQNLSKKGNQWFLCRRVSGGHPEERGREGAKKTWKGGLGVGLGVSDCFLNCVCRSRLLSRLLRVQFLNIRKRETNGFTVEEFERDTPSEGGRRGGKNKISSSKPTHGKVPFWC